MRGSDQSFLISTDYKLVPKLACISCTRKTCSCKYSSKMIPGMC